MSSKDLDDICSSDEWGESMDVAENETTNGMSTEPNVNTLNVPAESSVNLPLSPSIEMSESNEVRAQKSPVEMDPVSPNDNRSITEVEMMNETSVNDDTEMKDLSVKSPEDIGELKSPSPTPVEMIEENTTVESIKSPIVPAIEMNEPEESEILNSPLPSKELEEEKSTLEVNEEEEALKSPISNEKDDKEENLEGNEGTTSEEPNIDNAETGKPVVQVEDKKVEEKAHEEDKEIDEKVQDEDLNKSEKEPTEPVKESSETLEKSTEEKSDVQESDKKDGSERCESTEIRETNEDSTTQMSDADNDGIANFDDGSQMSGDTSKDAIELRNKLDTVEGVTVPGGADDDVNLEEESGDDPLGAAGEDKTETTETHEEEILGDTTSILPHRKISEGSADGDEILPDATKGAKKDDTDDSSKVKEKEKDDKSKDEEKSKESAETENVAELETKIEIEEEKSEGAAKEDSDQVDKGTDAEEKEENVDQDKDTPAVAADEDSPAADVDCPAAPDIEVMEIDDDDTEKDFTGDEIEPIEEYCHQCKETKMCNFKIESDLVPLVYLFFCNKNCRQVYHIKQSKRKKKEQEKSELKVKMPAMEAREEPPLDVDTEPLDIEEAYKRRCSQCKHEISGNKVNNLSWETMDFCDEDCLGAYQKELGASCANCKGPVASSSMGKYCVRFGFNVRQFCSGTCLEEFKKGLKVCSYCQKDITIDVEGFLAPIGDKGQFKDFCSQTCMQNYEVMSSGKPRVLEQAKCAVCCEDKDITAEVLQIVGNQKLCSNPCLAAYKFANDLQTETCEMCKKHFDLRRPQRQIVYYNDTRQFFCSKTCLNVNTLASRKIVVCSWCKVKKYNFDMIRKLVNQLNTLNPQPVMLCSLNCLALYQVSVSATTSKCIVCDQCHKRAQGVYHLTMSDATIRNFCEYQCCLNFQAQFSTSPIMAQAPTPTPMGAPMKITHSATSSTNSSIHMPVISNVTSLAPQEPAQPAPPPPPPQIKILQQTFVKPTQPKQGVNKITQCHVNMLTKATSCKPVTSSKHTQTDDPEPTKILIPVPVPIYIPAPMHMFTQFCPVPVPFPIPIPVPIFVPTTRNTAKGISKEIKRIQEQIPRDPFEAELLMMAEMVAEDKRGDATSSDSDDDDNGADMGADAVSSPPPEPLADSPANSAVDTGEVEFNSDGIEPTPSFGDDMLQMALKMASELTEPNAAQTLDLETALPVSVAPPPPPPQHHASVEEEEVKPPEVRQTRKRGRRPNTDWSSPAVNQVSKRTRTNSQDTNSGAGTGANLQVARASNGSPPAEPPDPALEADPNLSLKYTYGVLAFRKWIKQKNTELLAKSGRAAKLFKTDILQLSTDELNFALCMFVREVRKPDGEEYAPDIVYYLCLGIQLYLYRSNRIDNIFTDAYYEKFTESLNEISARFVTRLNDRTLVTRIEEEHLWESQQLGAHSPHVLLSTLMFFNTKFFLLTEVEDHMRLSFTHVMKHWKRNHAQPGKTGSTRNVLLRYYPPQSVLDADERKKKVYEQQENEANPLRCPVKLYEFYVSKCPESVRGRNDVFYLLPERSCVPDSPVWYSTMALPRDSISKMLNRIRMVREVLNLLHSLNY